MERLREGTCIVYKGEKHIIVKVWEFREDISDYGKYLYITNKGDRLYRCEFEVISELESDAVVISAYTCCGKTYAYEHYKDNYCIIDMDLSDFSWLKDSNGDKTLVRNPDFPNNYISHIKSYMKSADVIFVDSHPQVRQALQDAGIHFITVYPNEDLLDELVGRMYRNGYSEGYIELQIKHWDEIMGSITKYPVGDGLIRLGHNEYLDNLEAFIHFAKE